MADEFKLNRPLSTDKTKTLVLEESDPRAAFVIGGKGSIVSDADVKKYGLDDSHQLVEEDATVADSVTQVADPKGAGKVVMGTVTPGKAGSEKESVNEPEETVEMETVSPGESGSERELDEDGEESESDSESSDLDSLKVPQLRKVAEKEGVELTGITRRDDIIAAIEEKREEAAK